MAREKYKKYDEGNLKKAVEQVLAGKLRPNKAAKVYGVPRMTIIDYVAGRSHVGGVSGHGTFLLPHEEEDLKQYLMYMSQHGWGLMNKQMRILAQVIKETRTKHKENIPSFHWAKTFLARHKLSLRKSSLLDKGRASQVSKSSIEQYFHTLKSLCDQYQFEERFMLNMDESGFGKAPPTKDKVVSVKGADRPYQKQVFNSQHVTLVSCIAANGVVLDPLVIFLKSNPTSRYSGSLPKEWHYGCSESGFINRDLFEQWFHGVFIQYVQKERRNEEPVLLTMDNHESHLSPSVIKSARDHNIHILALPPHHSHLLQPLDKLFGILKDKFYKLCHATGIVAVHSSIGKAQVPIVLQEAMDEVWSKHLVKSSFAQVGMFPLDMNKINVVHLPEGKNNSSPDCQTPVKLEPPCQTCGRRKNFLIEKGIVKTKLLEDILVLPILPATEIAKKVSRRIPGSRILTGNDMQDFFKKKEESCNNKTKQNKKKRKQSNPQKIRLYNTDLDSDMEELHSDQGSLSQNSAKRKCDVDGDDERKKQKKAIPNIRKSFRKITQKTSDDFLSFGSSSEDENNEEVTKVKFNFPRKQEPPVSIDFSDSETSEDEHIIYHENDLADHNYSKLLCQTECDQLELPEITRNKKVSKNVASDNGTYIRAAIQDPVGHLCFHFDGSKLYDWDFYNTLYDKLDDEVINNYMRIQQMKSHENTLYLTTQNMDQILRANTANEFRIFGKERNRKGMKALCSYSKFVGIHNQSGHWVVYVFDAENGRPTITYVNSFGELDCDIDKALAVGRNFLRHNNIISNDQSMECTPQVLKHQKQMDSISCGVFATHFATTLLTSNNINDKFDIKSTRSLIVATLLSVSGDLEIFCTVCGNEDDVNSADSIDWKCCDGCSRWFHEECIRDIPQRSTALFLCRQCNDFNEI